MDATASPEKRGESAPRKARGCRREGAGRARCQQGRRSGGGDEQELVQDGGGAGGLHVVQGALPLELHVHQRLLLGRRQRCGCVPHLAPHATLQVTKRVGCALTGLQRRCGGDQIFAVVSAVGESESDPPVACDGATGTSLQWRTRQYLDRHALGQPSSAVVAVAGQPVAR